MIVSALKNTPVGRARGGELRDTGDSRHPGPEVEAYSGVLGTRRNVEGRG